jgi:hypothetical protein
MTEKQLSVGREAVVGVLREQIEIAEGKAAAAGAQIHELAFAEGKFDQAAYDQAKQEGVIAGATLVALKDIWLELTGAEFPDRDPAASV